MDWTAVIEEKRIWVVCFDLKNEPLFCSAFLTRSGAMERVTEHMEGEEEDWTQIDEFLWEHRNGRDRIAIDHAPIGT